MLDGFSNGEGENARNAEVGPPPPRQPFQPSPTPLPASHQETFQNWWFGPSQAPGDPGPKPWAPSPWEPGPQACPPRLLHRFASRVTSIGLRQRVGLRRTMRDLGRAPRSGWRCRSLSVFHIRGPGPSTARASVNARTHLPVTTAASSRRASVSQVWPVGRRTEPEAL